MARDAAAEARPRRDGAARGALGQPRGDRPPRHRGHGQDARRRARRGAPRDRVDRGGLRHPAPAEGREPRGRRDRSGRRAGAPAGRRLRRDHAVQLPGDDPALVPALRDRLRQHLHPQAVRARPAPVRADRRADRGHRRDSRAASSTSSTARATRSRPSSTTRTSTRSRSSARPRPRGWSPSARLRPASASRRSAARRTRSSSCPTPISTRRSPRS